MLKSTAAAEASQGAVKLVWPWEDVPQDFQKVMYDPQFDRRTIPSLVKHTPFGARSALVMLSKQLMRWFQADSARNDLNSTSCNNQFGVHTNPVQDIFSLIYTAKLVLKGVWMGVHASTRFVSVDLSVHRCICRWWDIQWGLLIRLQGQINMNSGHCSIYTHTALFYIKATCIYFTET